MKNKDVKEAIIKAQTHTEIDEILEKTWCKTDADKLQYLKQLFDLNDSKLNEHDKHDAYHRAVRMIMDKYHK